MKKWDELDSEHEQFIVLSYYGQTDFVFSIRKLPDFRYDEANSIHEEYLKRLKRAYRKYLNKDGYDGYSHDIKMVWKIGLTDTEIESLLQDRRPVKQWLQNVALQVKEELESIVRFKAERMAELDDNSDSNEADSASVERPIHNESNYPSTWIYAKDKDVEKTPCNNDTANMASLGLQSSTLTAIQDGNEIKREGFAMVLERQDKMLELLQRQATLKDAEQTPPPSPEQPQETNNQIDGDNTSEETDGEWVLASKFADDHSIVDGKHKTSMSKRILGNLSNDRQGSKETNRTYKGYPILVDSKGREYFKISYKGVCYKRARLENDIEFLTSRKRTSRH